MTGYISGIQLKWDSYCSVSHLSSSLIFQWVMHTIHFNTGLDRWFFDKPFACNLVLYPHYFQYSFLVMFSHFCFSSPSSVACFSNWYLITVVAICKNNGRIIADWSFSSSSLLVDKEVSKPRSTVGMSTNKTSKSLFSHHYEYNLFKSCLPLMTSS